MSTDPVRDSELAKVIELIEVPEPDDDFFLKLRARLTDRSSFVETHHKRFKIPRIAYVAAGLAALLVVAIVPDLGFFSADKALASEVKAKVEHARANITTLRGTTFSRTRLPESNEFEEERSTFVIASDGSFHVRSITGSGGSDVSYYAPKRLQQGFIHNDDPGVVEQFRRFGYEFTNAFFGPYETPSFVDGEAGALARALVEAKDPKVKETRYKGKKAWLVEFEIPPSPFVPELSIEHIRVTVDAETGLPVRSESSGREGLDREVRLEEILVDQPVTEADFMVAFPPDLNIQRTDMGFKFVPVERAHETVGYDPLLPAQLPDGYRLSQVAVSASVEEPVYGPVDGGNNRPWVFRNLVAASYRRGLDEILVFNYSERVAEEVHSEDEGSPPAPPGQYRIRRGELVNETASLSFDFGVLSTATVETGRLTIILKGDLTPKGVIDLLDSFAAPSGS